MVHFLTILLCCLIAAGAVYHLAAAFCVWEFFRDRNESFVPARLAPVSVLKPMKGLDPEFKDNIISFCGQDHPEYEVLLGFSEQDQAAASAAREQVMADLDPPVRVVTSGFDLGPNRKVSNLQGLVEAARHPLLVFSDSDMRVPPHYLRTILGEYRQQQNVGMVTNLYKISEPGTPGIALESLTIALDLIPSVLVARRLEGMQFGLGASMLLSKQALSDIGGLDAVGEYLADDYQLGNRLSKKGYVNVLSRLVLETVPGPMTLREHLLHQLRWARTYRASRPKGFFGYGITHMLPFSLGLLLLQQPGALTLSVLGAVLLLRFGTAALMHARVLRSKQWLVWLPLLPLKDLLGFGTWAWSFMGSSVSWRGRTYRVLRDGRIRENA
jgi:ceramide glucosyltransferase